jgi:putative transcriptional regulator
MSKTTTTAKIRSDGTVVEVLADGNERPFPDSPTRPMTEAEIEAAACADPDARPMTAEELRTARWVPRIKTLRRALGLTQEEFAGRYHVPLGTLRDWEQGRTEPDQPARAYLSKRLRAIQRRYAARLPSVTHEPFFSVICKRNF